MPASDDEFARVSWSGGASPAGDHPHAPAPAAHRGLLAGPLGGLVARPWLDRAVLASLKRAYFPLSRAWAAADAADGTVEAFWHQLGLPRRHERRDRLERALARFAAAEATAAAVAAAWQRVFFAADATSPNRRTALEAARLASAHAWNTTRRDFAFLLPAGLPRARLTVETPAAVAAGRGPDSRILGEFALSQAMPPIEQSQALHTALGREFWLRFASPSPRLADTVYARVHAPAGVTDPPTVILGHGVCVEFDHWHGLIDETEALVRLGVRVIRPEAPWHGRRRPKGYFGGERMIARFPTGALDLFSGAVQEWAALADWARATSAGPLGFGGSSLGALTSQLAASLAHDWPLRLRPDALYLITHSDRMGDAMLGGALATLWADPAVVAAGGWTPELAARWLAPLDPVLPPVVAPACIVSVLGERDVITPFPTGRALVERWGVPAENLFVSRRGHFTIPLSLKRNRAPTERFAALLKGQA